MPESRDPQRGTYLSTGWRVVGSAAEQITERAASALARVQPGRAADTLYALACTFEPAVQGRRSVEVLLDALTDDIRRTWEECPPLRRDEPVDRAASRFGGLHYDVMTEPGREWLGDLVWRAVHPVVAGAAVTTRVMIEERASFTRLTVRVTADDGLGAVRGYVGAGQAQPAFIRAIRSTLRPTWNGAPVGPLWVEAGTVEDLVRSTLADPERTLPAAILSPFEDGDFVLDPDELAWDLLGRARLHVIRAHRETFRLSDAVGDASMSCYWGAVRAYMPGWSRHDDPRDHPLLIADRLADPFMRAAWYGELGTHASNAVTFPQSIEERRVAQHTSIQTQHATSATPATTAPIPAKDEARSQPEARDVAPVTTSPTPAPAPAADTQLVATLLAEMRALGATVRQVSDELERLRTLSAVRSSSTSAIERRLGRLEELLENAFAATAGDLAATGGAPTDDENAARDDDAEGRPALVDVVREISESHPDALVFLDSAYTAAADSPYEDPERVRAILDAMARVARRRRDGALGTSLRDAFADFGLDYRPAIARSTPARLREQYRFLYRNREVVEAEEHIALGNTYDPRRCLRIYFSSRVANEPRFVIGHVGRHFDVITTT